MPAELATLLCAMAVVGLFVLDRDDDARTSKALGIPLIWLSLAASRSASQWLGLAASARTVDQALDGNPLDRNIQLVLMVAGAIVLFGRGRKVRTLVRANGPILVFALYCALSVVWSDYSMVAFKRWTKAVGELIMVLIVLTEADRPAAFRRLLARFGFLLVPASVLLIKYYPAWGLTFSQAGDRVRYIGVTTDKNMLGVVCLIAGLGCLGRLLEAFRDQGRFRFRKPNRPLLAQMILFAMVLWLFAKANSMTSLACFVLAGGVMTATSFRAFARNRTLVHVLVGSVLSFAFAILFLGFGGGALQGELGRDATLTGRTELWGELFEMNQQPLFGTGFETFWLGERIEHLWKLHWWHPNEAHNGYIEVFLNLGWIGISLIAVVIATGYRNAMRALRREPHLGRLRLGVFVAEIAYSFTEAAFRVMNPVWFMFLLATMAIPESMAARRATPSRARQPVWTETEPLVHSVVGAEPDVSLDPVGPHDFATMKRSYPEATIPLQPRARKETGE